MKCIVEKTDSIVLRKTQKDDLDFVVNSEYEPDNAQYVG